MKIWITLFAMLTASACGCGQSSISKGELDYMTATCREMCKPQHGDVSGVELRPAPGLRAECVCQDGFHYVVNYP